MACLFEQIQKMKGKSYLTPASLNLSVHVKILGVFLRLVEMWSDLKKTKKKQFLHLSEILGNAVTGPDQMSCGMCFFTNNMA